MPLILTNISVKALQFTTTRLVAAAFGLLFTLNLTAQTDVKIGTTPGSISPSAVLEAASTTKGFLLPRLTTTQMNAITSPANGLTVYNTNDSCIYIYRNSLWQSTSSPTYALSWGILGNPNTSSTTNFIGTTDNIPLSMRVNNQKAGRIGIVGETYLGYQAGNTVSTGQNNSFIGYQAGTATTNAWGNTAVGNKALLANTTGGSNTAIGDSAMVLNTTGANNIAIGYQAGINITTGSNNIAIGQGAQVPTATSSNQLSIGNWIYGLSGLIGISTTTPQYKLDIDAQTGSSGNPLRLLGLNVGATSDSIISSSSGILRRLSINQVIANAWNITGNSGTVDGTNFIGTTDNIPFSIRVNNQKAGRIDNVNNNVTFGYQAGNVNTGTQNLFMGHQAGFSNTTGYYNSFLGNLSGYTNTTGYQNTFVGDSSGFANTTGYWNTALG